MKLLFDQILKNLRRVQERTDLEVDEHLEPRGFGATAPAPLNFSVEMETPVWPDALWQRSRNSRRLMRTKGTTWNPNRCRSPN